MLRSVYGVYTERCHINSVLVRVGPREPPLYMKFKSNVDFLKNNSSYKKLTIYSCCLNISQYGTHAREVNERQGRIICDSVMQMAF
jgi:hypothetical protein